MLNLGVAGPGQKKSAEGEPPALMWWERTPPICGRGSLPQTLAVHPAGSIPLPARLCGATATRIERDSLSATVGGSSPAAARGLYSRPPADATATFTRRSVRAIHPRPNHPKFDSLLK